MKKEIWGFNVIGPQGLDAHNDFAVGPNDEGDDVVLRVNQAELTGKEFETLKEIAEGGPTPGGGGFPEQDLDDPTFVPEANHYYKQKAGEKPGPTLQPFEVGDVLKVGDKIHFDTTKEAELLAWMKTLEYDRGEGGTLHAMVYTHIEEPGESYDIDILSAHCLPGERFGIENNVYILRSGIVGLQETDGAVYISEDLSSLSPALTQGFHTDANGDIAIVADGDHGMTEYPVSVVIDTNPPAWNGIFAGVMEEAPASKFIDGVIYFYDGEEYHAITGEGGEGTLDYNKLENVPIINLTENKTTVLSPFEIGQVLNSESVLHIDTNKEEEFLSYLQTLEYPEQIPIAAFMRAKRTADSALIALLALYQDNIYRFGIGRVGEESKMIYVSQDFYDEETGTQYYKGFQNLDADGNWQLTQLLTPADGDFIIDQIVDTNPQTWNGAIISSATEGTTVSPTPVDGEFYKRNGQIYKYTAAKPAELEAFEVGQTLSQGDKIHFDITKGDELAEYLRGLEYDSSHNGPVFMEGGSNFKLNAANPADNVYVLMLTDMGGSLQNFTVIYATDVVEGIITTPGFQYGEHMLDNNGDYTLLAGYTIATINDTDPPQWNGVFAGIMGESQPELYDKVVLESELNGTTIVDLGSIELAESGTEWSITKAQYDQVFGDNVIVKVTVSNGGSDFTVYAPKNSQYTDSNASRLSFSGMVDVQQFYIEISSDDPGEYMAYFELVEPEYTYRHDIVIDCTSPAVFKAYLSVVYYNDNQVNKLSGLSNIIGSGHDYPVSGYYNNLSTGLKPAICINAASNSVSMKYIDGASEYSATCDENSTFTITDNVTTLAK